MRRWGAEGEGGAGGWIGWWDRRERWGQGTRLCVKGGPHLESLQSLPGVGLVGFVHQLSHLLGAARLTLLIYWVYPAPQPTLTQSVHIIKLLCAV